MERAPPVLCKFAESQLERAGGCAECLYVQVDADAEINYQTLAHHIYAERLV